MDPMERDRLERPRCCDKSMDDAGMVEIFYDLTRPHPDFVYACTICRTWSTARKE